MMEGEKMESHQKGFFLKLKCCSPLRILTSPLFEETLGAFLFLPLFSLFFSMLRLLRTWGVLMILEEKNHFFKNFFFKWNDMVMTVDILVVDTYSRIGLCTPI
jgi:hypothetical protein